MKKNCIFVMPKNNGMTNEMFQVIFDETMKNSINEFIDEEEDLRKDFEKNEIRMPFQTYLNTVHAQKYDEQENKFGHWRYFTRLFKNYEIFRDKPLLIKTDEFYDTVNQNSVSYFIWVENIKSKPFIARFREYDEFGTKKFLEICRRFHEEWLYCLGSVETAEAIDKQLLKDASHDEFILVR